MDLQQFGTNLNNFVVGYEATTDKLHSDNTAAYIDLNEDAMDKGEDALGNDLPEYHNPAYAQMKRSRGSKSNGKWDLKHTGDFRSAMKMNNQGFIFSTNWKQSKLVSLLGEDIFGVQPVLLDRHIKEQMIPEFEDIIKTKLGI